MALIVQKADEKLWRIEMKNQEREARRIQQETEREAKIAQRAKDELEREAKAAQRFKDRRFTIAEELANKEKDVSATKEAAAMKEAKLARDKQLQEKAQANMAAQLQPIKIVISDEANELDTKIEERNKQLANAAKDRDEYLQRNFGALEQSPTQMAADPNYNKSEHKADLRLYKATVREMKNEVRETLATFSATHGDGDVVFNVNKVGNAAKV